MFTPHMNQLNIKLLLAMLLIGQACVAYAEKADRSKPINIVSDKLNVDDAKRVSTFEGRVELTQGTLRVIADKIVVTEDAEGYKKCVATGRVANFRQKREASNEYVEGYGERIEYDSRIETVNFYVRARVKRDQDDVRGDHIIYSTQTETFHVDGSSNSNAAGSGRVHATIQPKNKDTQESPSKTAAPKIGLPDIDTSKVEPVKIELQKVEVPKIEMPKIEEQKADAPKVAVPKVNDPIPENQPAVKP